jgi:predicted DsbA family dithiol-disulfide isomerase
MAEEVTRFYFDFVDPLSYLLELEIHFLGGDVSNRIERIGLELRPPPTRLTLIDDPALAPRWKRAREVADTLGVELTPPKLVPWSRKALELHLHAYEYDLAGVVRREIFEGYFVRGVDIGRIDVLVEIARSAGLDATEAKAVLDVDRFQAQVFSAREAAALAGVVQPPVIARGAARLEGFHKRTSLGTFLATDSGTSRP